MEACRRPSDTSIKVAVLDTGVDSGHPKLQESLKRNKSRLMLEESKNFINAEGGVDDRVGHGTAVCDLLLRIAKVSLYVGKVCESARLGDKDINPIANVRCLYVPVLSFVSLNVALLTSHVIRSKY